MKIKFTRAPTITKAAIAACGSMPKSQQAIILAWFVNHTVKQADG